MVFSKYYMRKMQAEKKIVGMVGECKKMYKKVKKSIENVSVRMEKYKEVKGRRYYGMEKEFRMIIKSMQADYWFLLIFWGPLVVWQVVQVCKVPVE